MRAQRRARSRSRRRDRCGMRAGTGPPCRKRGSTPAARTARRPATAAAIPGWRRSSACSAARAGPSAATPATMTWVGESIPGWKPRHGRRGHPLLRVGGQAGDVRHPEPDAGQVRRGGAEAGDAAIATTAGGRRARCASRVRRFRPLRIGVRRRSRRRGAAEERPAEDRKRGGHERDGDGHRDGHGDREPRPELLERAQRATSSATGRRSGSPRRRPRSASSRRWPARRDARAPHARAASWG